VPALVLGDVTIWDSLAICESAAEMAPTAQLLPRDRLTRAVCRSVVSEMHAGFAALRRDLQMNIRRRTEPRPWPEDTRADLARVEQLWTTVRARYGSEGPFLFGARTLADAFFAPVVTRLRTYGVPLSPISAAYSEAVLADSAFREWEAAAQVEPWANATTDAL
jgi:glutathione S-transferase